MQDPDPDPDRADSPLPPAYSALLGEAADVAAKAMDRIHALNDRYPGGVPAVPLGQLDRAHADPGAERRGTVRLASGPGRASVGTGAGPPADAEVVDRCPGGLSLRVAALLLPGAVVTVRLADRGGEHWFPAQVRHCRPDGDAWLVGCAFTADRPAV